MGSARTLTEKIIDEHLAGSTEEEIELRIDQILLEDATGTMACLQFERLGVDRVAVPTVSYVDHNTLQFDNKNSEDHAYLRSWAARYGALYSRPGNGISHYLHLERFGRPGHVLLGADSHTTMAGALGMLAIGAGATEVAVAMAGKPYVLERPRIAGVELRGRFRPWVQSKDIVLELLRRRDVRGGRGLIFEFFGDGVAGLTATDRGTICNMVMETGATTGIFPSDEQTLRWLTLQGREEQFVELAADAGASYAELEVIDLDELEPLIAIPSSPGNVVPVSETAGVETRQVCVGSSVNSSFEDVAIVAAVLRERTLPERVDLTLTPGSRQILDLLVRSGVYTDALASGARILEPACGPCIGMGQAPAAGAVSVRTFNRNFPGRSGTADDRVYLCSPATAAATALRGEITDPRDLGEPPELPPAPAPDPSVSGGQFIAPPDNGSGVELEKGSNIVPPPEVPPLPDDDRRPCRDRCARRRLDRGHGARRRARRRHLVEHSRVRPVHVPALRPRLRDARRGVGWRHLRRRPQLRPGLEQGASRLRGALPRHPRHRGQELRPHPPHESHRAGNPSAHLRRRCGLRPGRAGAGVADPRSPRRGAGGRDAGRSRAPLLRLTERERAILRAGGLIAYSKA